MSIILGCLLGAGVLLVVSSVVWPARSRRRSRRPGRGRLRSALVLAGLPGVPPLAFLAVALVCALTSAAVCAALVPVPVLIAAAWLLGLALPFAALSWRAKSARRLQRTVWPDVVDDLVSSIRAGRALPESLAVLAVTGPPAVRGAFAEFDRDYRRTGRFSDGLDRLKIRLADPVADRIVETLRMAREVGGSDLTVVLRGLGSDLREETSIRQEVEARQSWVVNAARLGVAAPWVVLALLATRPEAQSAYASPAGTVVVVVGLVVSVIAYRIMLAIGRLPDEPRWFG